MQTVLRNSRNNFSLFCMYLPIGAALVTIGAKCWMVARFASPTPYWDQWDAEGGFLYPKFMDGTLRLADLIAPHNEHRVLMTRLWSLLALALEGYWDSILQMLANTLLLGAFVALLVVVFRPLLERRAWIAFALFTTVVFALPFGWENTLSAFHSQWYFLLLFSLAGLALIIDAPALIGRWWLALMLIIASYFSMAGGLMTAAAAFAVCLLQALTGQRSGGGEWLGLTMLAALAAAMLLAVPMNREDPVFIAHSVQQFLQAIFAIGAWPVARNPIGALILCAVVIHAPAWATSFAVAVKSPPRTDRGWLIVALTVWLVLQSLVIAYGRAISPVMSRYADLYVIAFPLNFACLLLFLKDTAASRQRRRLALSATALWLLLVIPGAGGALVKHFIPETMLRGAAGRTQTENLRSYLTTNDFAVLKDKVAPDIPYPDASHLAAILSQPVIVGLLPPELVGADSAARAQARGLARYTGDAVEALKKFALRWGFLLMPAGFLLFAFGAAQEWRQRQTPAQPPQGA